MISIYSEIICSIVLDPVKTSLVLSNFEATLNAPKQGLRQHYAECGVWCIWTVTALL